MEKKKKSIIIPLPPKKARPQVDNDYPPVALTTSVLKLPEKLLSDVIHMEVKFLPLIVFRLRT